MCVVGHSDFHLKNNSFVATYKQQCVRLLMQRKEGGEDILVFDCLVSSGVAMSSSVSSRPHKTK